MRENNMTEKNKAKIQLNYPVIDIFVDGQLIAYDDQGNIQLNVNLNDVLSAVKGIAEDNQEGVKREWNYYSNLQTNH